MRILYFANANSYHTAKWCRHFLQAGHEVHVASLERCTSEEMLGMSGVTLHWLQNAGRRQGGDLQKLAYLKTVRRARALIEELDPAIVHAHYASSYGLVCSLACSRPYFLSVWGTDVYEFPRKSMLHRAVLSRALKRCTWLLSTSEAMAGEARRYVERPIEVTPFGVDMERFNPARRSRPADPSRLVVGTVKALDARYGIDVLLRAASIVRTRRPDLGLSLRIAGKGKQEDQLKDLAVQLGIDDCTTWLGFISQEEAACEWADLDIAVVPSLRESFGVSAVEAQASGVPLIISDVPGLREACDGGSTARVVPVGDHERLADAIEALADNPSRRVEMARVARRYVESTYELESCFKKVERLYQVHDGGNR